MAKIFMSVSTAQLFELVGCVVLVLAMLVMRWSARRKSRALQAQISKLRKDVDRLQQCWERILMGTINRSVGLSASPPLRLSIQGRAPTCANFRSTGRSAVQSCVLIRTATQSS